MEQWKKIEGTNHNWISSKGRLYSTYRKGGFMAPRLNKYGYLRIRLIVDGKKKDFTLHQLVAKYFIENPNNLPTVDHIDGNKINNNVENLQWMSFADNTSKGKCIPVDQYTLDGTFVKSWKSAKEAELAMSGKNNSSITNNIAGRTKSSHGFIWKKGSVN